MNIDKEFTLYPSSMVYVSEKTTKRYLTNPIKFILTPAMNGSVGNGKNFFFVLFFNLYKFRAFI